MIDELVAQLIGATGRNILFAVAWVENRRIFQARIEHYTVTSAAPFEVQDTHLSRCDKPSLPLWLYQLPPSYTPAMLVLGVIFPDTDPADIWGIFTPHLHEVSTLRYERRLLHDGSNDWYYLDFEKPVQHHYYGIGWSYDS